MFSLLYLWDILFWIHDTVASVPLPRIWNKNKNKETISLLVLELDIIKEIIPILVLDIIKETISILVLDIIKETISLLVLDIIKEIISLLVLDTIKETISLLVLDIISAIGTRQYLSLCSQVYFIWTSWRYFTSSASRTPWS